MFQNGVSHLSVANDVAGIEAIVHWLSFVPKVFIIYLLSFIFS
jgi:hypothetical protein